MAIYQSLDLTKEVKCNKCGNKYTERLYEHIGGPKYWSGNCSCTPTSYDSVARDLESDINKFNGNIVTSNWDNKLIDTISSKLCSIIGKLGRYIYIDGYYYPKVYPYKKAIANYIGKDVTAFSKQYKNIQKEDVFLKEILNITNSEYTHYLSYLLYLRKENK